MRLVIHQIDTKNLVIFVSGFKKNYKTWNKTETNKILNIEKKFRKTCTTILVDIDEEDYKLPVPIICNKMLSCDDFEIKENTVIVAHSYGCFYALYLAEKLKHVKLVLIEPVIKSPSYFDYLIEKSLGETEEGIEKHKIKNYDTLPDGKLLSSQVILRVHVNINNAEIPNIKEYNALTSKNIKSQLVIHYKKSHMIHYTQPDLIFTSIQQMLMNY